MVRSLSYASSVMVAPVRNRSEALERLAHLAPHLLARGVTSLRVFGSAGRDAMTADSNAMTADSDVDILVGVGRTVGAFEFLDLQEDLARTLGRRVDLVTPAAIKERMRARIELVAVEAVGVRCPRALHRHAGDDGGHRVCVPGQHPGKRESTRTRTAPTTQRAAAVLQARSRMSRWMAAS
jgi:uncharacterized protein